jgi:hypothetical protein
VVAAKAPDRFFHWNAHGTPRLEWQEDPFQQRLTVITDRMFAERPLHRLFIEQRLQPGDPLPGSAPNELLLIALGWWPLARPAPRLDDQLPAALSAVAQSSMYQAGSRLEQVEGRWCQILEYPGRDRLWLDTDRGCAVVVRQISYPSVDRVHRVEFADFRELLPDVWVPFTLRNLHYERTAEGAVGRIVKDARLTVLRVQLNEAVDDARFRFEPLPGSAGQVEGEPLRQVVPGGEEFLDEVVEWIRHRAPLAGTTEGQTSRARGSDFALGALLGGVVGIALLWWRCWAPRQGVGS